MADALYESLVKHRDTHGKPLSVLFLNTGGTFSSVPNERGELAPLQDSATLERILMEVMGLSTLVEREVLEVKVNHLMAQDSSQLTDSQRQQIAAALEPEYTHIDGAIVLHGTDTGADTAKFLHLVLPYYNPNTLWGEDKAQFNWCKPVVLLSSQIPAVTGTSDRTMYKSDSDAPMNFSVALMLLADGKVGEAGILTNNLQAIRGTSSVKSAEIDIPPYRTDPGVPELAVMTGIGLRHNPTHFLSKQEGVYTPFVIKNAAKYSNQVAIVRDSSNLGILSLYRDRIKHELKGTGTDLGLKQYIPKVVMYETRGAGNVKHDDYPLLKLAEEEGVFVFRVPIPGGRIPPKKMYDTPGHEIHSVNLEAKTAKYKAMVVLALADQLRIPPEKRLGDHGFVHTMIAKQWGYEFLPAR